VESPAEGEGEGGGGGRLKSRKNDSKSRKILIQNLGRQYCLLAVSPGRNHICTEGVDDKMLALHACG
jgi:hypothetical protein